LSALQFSTIGTFLRQGLIRQFHFAVVVAAVFVGFVAIITVVTCPSALLSILLSAVAKKCVVL